MIAAVFDALDGKVARVIQHESVFGTEFDSLADMVSFCVAPSILIYLIFSPGLGFIGAIISFLPLLFGGIRLARFNVNAVYSKKDYFLGLPVPANAITISSYIWFHFKAFGNYGEAKTILALVISLSLLMVTRIHFSSIPRIIFHSKLDAFLKIVLIAGLVTATLIWQSYIIFPFFGIYIIAHLLIWLVRDNEALLQFLVRRRGS
jgi:CDP-diacylglycerol--serine O-phosphatidyltransferase